MKYAQEKSQERLNFECIEVNEDEKINTIKEAIESLKKQDVTKDLIEIAGILDQKGLTSLANKVDKVLRSQEFQTLEQDALQEMNMLEATLRFYRETHHIAENNKKLFKYAEVRKDNLPYEENCPFGLDIPEACKSVGVNIIEMTADKENIASNRENFKQTPKCSACPYAAEILADQNAVVCSWGTTTEGQQMPAIYRGSPIYPRLWSGFSDISVSRNPPVDFGNDSGFYR